MPVRGSDVGTWDTPVNGDFIAVDGYIGGVQTVNAAGSSPITLTSPAAFVPTPSAGPTQAQNGVIRFTGALTGNVQITLPLPGFVIVENLTTGAFVLSFRAIGSGEVIGVPQGGLMHIYNDGTNVRFVKGLGEFPGKMDFLGGVSTIPAWVSACTVPPFLIADGAVYNFSTYPALGALYVGNFGGNGITTFGVPDLRGRVPLMYDGTGTRITVAGCGLNGQTLGAVLDQQTQTLTLAQLPTGIISVPNLSTVNFNIPYSLAAGGIGGGAQNYINAGLGSGGSNYGSVTSALPNSTSSNTGGQSHPNVQPSQVAGIWLIKS